MACNNSCNNVSSVQGCGCGTSNNGFVIIIVLYILLAIILGSCFFY